MERKRHGLKSIIICTFMVIMITLSSFGGMVRAEGNEDEIYTISGYNKKDIITDPSGNKVPGYAFCLDDKARTPSGQEFIRIMLSEFEGSYQKRAYVTSTSKEYIEEKYISKASKERLLKLLVDEKNYLHLSKMIVTKSCWMRKTTLLIRSLIRRRKLIGLIHLVGFPVRMSLKLKMVQ